MGFVEEMAWWKTRKCFEAADENLNLPMSFGVEVSCTVL
jgi:hypothetical protein